jgi:uncharacterized protein (TIGR00369 family)
LQVISRDASTLNAEKRTSVNSDNVSQQLRKFMTEAVPYWRTLGLELKEVEPGRAVFEAEAKPHLMQNAVIHGGVLASIADSACAVAAISRVFPTNYATTINLQLAYLKPLVEGRFRAEGKCIKAGKTILFCEATVFDQKGGIICTASSQLMAVPFGR